ncbi:hypothetical protein D3C79_1113570 [compost metagenome]
MTLRTMDDNLAVTGNQVTCPLNCAGFNKPTEMLIKQLQPPCIKTYRVRCSIGSAFMDG